jgi:endonuclease YncB( thermonuclease family)
VGPYCSPAVDAAILTDLLAHSVTLPAMFRSMAHRPHSCLPSLCLLIAATCARADILAGRVVGVSDGDTITVLDNAKIQHKIRLAAIDAPEKGQAFGERAKENLSRLVFGRDVRVDWRKTDRYGRLVGTVWVAPPDVSCGRKADCPKTLDAGLAQLTLGLAWHFKRYANEQKLQQREQYAFAEEEARAERAGLWGDVNPVPPWEWRKTRH